MNGNRKVKLNELTSHLNPIEVIGDLSVEVSSIEYDSRRVALGALFVALPGEHVDGSIYIEEAIRRGAVAVVTQDMCALGGNFPCVRVKNARSAMAKLACVFWDNPSKKLSSFGVTGTNGKTTITFMLREILRAAGKTPGVLGTVRYEIGDRVLPAARTTPESPDVQKMLAQMVRVGCDSVAMEVSSHALDQYRIAGTEFDVAIFTNLTQDHLDYHGTLEEYFRVKSRLFHQKSEFAVINNDDPWGKKLFVDNEVSAEKITFGFEEGSQVRGYDAVTDENGSRMHISSPWGDIDISMSLIGRFNLSNALAAFAAAGAMGIPINNIAKALKEMEHVPGRLEGIPGHKKNGKRVFVDYAHTDDALLNVLKALREITPNKLIVVFGCGGNRDVKKRSLMGSVASRLADYSIITSDNPRTELPEKIAADIESGFDSERKYEIVLDRYEAIKRGIELVGKNDILLVAGKGHETYQEFNGTIVPFDDREVVREFI